MRRTITSWITLTLLGVSLPLTFIQEAFAIDVNQGIYMMSENSTKTGQYFPKGYTSHVFNKFLDSQEKCRNFLLLKDIQGYLDYRAKINSMPTSQLTRNAKKLMEEGNAFRCAFSSFADERDFIGIAKLITGPKTDAKGTYYEINKDYTNMSMLSLERSMIYDLDAKPVAEEKDIFQIKVFVHDNASTQAAKTIKDTKVIVTLKDNIITAKVGNDQIYSVDTSTLKNMSSQFELQFAKREDYPNVKIAARGGKLLADDGYHIIGYNATTNKNNITTWGGKYDDPIPADKMNISADRKTFTYTKGEQMGSFPYSYSLVLDLVVKKKIGGVCGNGAIESGEQCDLGVNNGKAGYACSASCTIPSTGNICGNGAIESGEQCDLGVNNGKAGYACSASCTTPAVASTSCTDLYYSNPTEFRKQGYECVTTDKKASGACTGEETIVKNGKSYGPCKLHPDTESVCTTCGCIDIDVSSPYVGDYQNLTYKVVISNESLSSLGAVVEVKSRKADDTPGVKKRTYIANDRMQGVLKEYTNEGDVSLTDDAGQVKMYVTRTSPRRISDKAFKNVPAPDIDKDSIVAFLNNPKDNPLIVRNLLPGTRAGTVSQKSDGDEITIEIPAKARTSASGKDKYGFNYIPFLGTTQFIDYLFYLKTPTNGAQRAISLSRPYFVTYNAGDVFTSIAITGIVNARELLRQDASKAPGTGSIAGSFNEVSGFLFDTAKTVQNFNVAQRYTDITYADSFTSSVDKNIEKVTSSKTNTFASQQVTVSSEQSLTSTNFSQRPDGERIFTYDVQNGKVIIDGGSAGIKIGDRSTIVIKNGDLEINSNIEYASSTGNKVPAIAFIVQNGVIRINPAVTRIDGVYYTSKKITAPDTWKSYYEKGAEPRQLLVNGSLLGNVDELLASRPFVESPTKAGAALSINYDGRMIATPPPGLKEILGGTFEKLKQ